MEKIKRSNDIYINVMNMLKNYTKREFLPTAMEIIPY
jgi:hypothetical protein